MLIGYARVSKVDQQDTRAQVKALREAGCKRIYEESASGGRSDRPELHRALDQLREGDILVVWKLDRLSRSLKDLLHILEKIAEADAGFRSITEHVDTTTPAGRMMLQLLGAFAEFERSMIRERTRMGLQVGVICKHYCGSKDNASITQAVNKVVVATRVLLTHSLFASDILHSLLRRVSVTKPTSAPLRF